MISSLLFVEAFATSFVVALFAVRWLRDVAPRMGLIDWPGEDRRLHTRPTAVVGGIGIVLAMAVTLTLLVTVHDLAAAHPEELSLLLPVGVGALAMALVGLWDDLAHLPSSVKFGFQLLVAVAVYIAGVQIPSAEIPLVGVVDFAAPVSFGLTVFWMVGITNAFNLVDGADGLAGGAALMSTIAIFIVCLVMGHGLVGLFLAATAGATLAFLHFNFPPASVFLGDAGSLFLGFMLAGVGLVSSTKAATVVSIAVPVVAFGLPVLDTGLAILRRWLRGDSIARPDRGHIHHRLIDLGHSPRKVVLILYAACGTFGLLSLLVLSSDGMLMGPIFGVVALASWFGIQRLHIPELLELRRLLHHGTGIRQHIARNVAVRRYARRLREAESVEEVFELLTSGLSNTEFREIELWMADGLVAATSGTMTLHARQDGEYGGESGQVLTWTRDGGTADDRKTLEVNIPVLATGDRDVARLILRRDVDAQRSGELTVVVDELLPAAAEALGRIPDVAGLGLEEVEVGDVRERLSVVSG